MDSPELLYDSDCGFCRWCLAKVLAWDRRHELRPIALDSPEADRLLAGMPEYERMVSWHLVDAQGDRHSGGAAFAPLFRILPAGGALAAVAAGLPRATDRGYRWIAGHRSAFGRLVSEGAKRRADRRIAERS